MKQAIFGAAVVGLALFGIGSDVAWAADNITEDSEGWSCVDDGNRICGPGNANGAPAGCYDDGGVLVAAWPCHTVDIGNGQSDKVVEWLAPK